MAPTDGILAKPSSSSSWDTIVISTADRRGGIAPDDYERYEKEFRGALYEMDERKVHEKFQKNEDYYEDQKECIRPSFYHEFHENCNSVHEYTLDRPIEDPLQSMNFSYKGSGAYRMAWLAQERGEEFIFKTFLYMKKRDYDANTFFMSHMDANIMEKLTSSQRIVSAYAHCGTAVLLERLASSINREVVPRHKVKGRSYGGYMPQKILDAYFQTNGDVQPLNNYTIAEKLDVALAIAETLAELHGFAEGVVLHGDVKLDQWLRSPSGYIKLNDFNFARILGFNPKTQKYCPFERCLSSGTYNSPEEFLCKAKDEQADTYVYGFFLYSLMTGLHPFYHIADLDSEDYERRVKDLEKPFIDPRYRNRSAVEAKFVELMEKAWIFEPEKRISIFEILKELRAVQASLGR